MEIMFDEILEYVNIIYIFLCNIITYVIITSIPKAKELATWWKRLISAVVALAAGLVFVLVYHSDTESIICSFFIQFLMYDYVLKWVFSKIGKPKNQDTDSDDLVIS